MLLVSRTRYTNVRTRSTNVAGVTRTLGQAVDRRYYYYNRFRFPGEMCPFIYWESENQDVTRRR